MNTPDSLDDKTVRLNREYETRRNHPSWKEPRKLFAVLPDEPADSQPAPPCRDVARGVCIGVAMSAPFWILVGTFVSKLFGNE